MTKTCSVCAIDKDRTEFHRFVHAKDGLTPRCKECTCESGRAYREANRDRILALKRQRYQDNPDVSRKRNAAWKAQNAERHRYLVRRSHLKQMYGMTPENYEALLVAQGNTCALCDRPAGVLRLHVDHDHGCCPGKRSCGQCVRGLLCRPCNRLLGWLDNHRERIDSYLAGKATQDGH